MNNCINCGAPLDYTNRKDGLIECKYCKTQYNYDTQTGHIKEYEVELEIMGKKRKFYIGDLEINVLYSNGYRNSSDILIRNKIAEKLKMNLIEI